MNDEEALDPDYQSMPPKRTVTAVGLIYSGGRPGTASFDPTPEQTRITALEAQLAEVTTQRDRLRLELDVMTGMVAEAGTMMIDQGKRWERMGGRPVRDPTPPEGAP